MDTNKNQESNITVRKATRDDMPQVFQLIREFAKYEKFDKEVNINANTLIEDGFERQPPSFGCFVADLGNGTIVGYALYFFCYKTWIGKSVFLEDLYVAPKYQKMGIGKKLFLSVARISYESSKRLDFHVYTLNDSAGFFDKFGAVSMTDLENWNLFRLNEDSYKHLSAKKLIDYC